MKALKLFKRKESRNSRVDRKEEDAMSEKVFLRPNMCNEKMEPLGSRCRSCGQLFFPPVQICFECACEELEIVTLSKRGKLYTYTISQMPASKLNAPFAIGWVDLPEGIRIFAPIKGWEERPIKIGMDMELIFETLWQEDDKEIIAPKFQPV
jgi:uncharacterized OB-fold protein